MTFWGYPLLQKKSIDPLFSGSVPRVYAWQCGTTAGPDSDKLVTDYQSKTTRLTL
jgi:hypothetical protein